MAKEGEEWVGSEEAIAPQQPKLSLCQKPLEEGVLSSSLSSATLVGFTLRIINQKHTHILEEEQLCLSHEEESKLSKESEHLHKTRNFSHETQTQPIIMQSDKIIL
jgi:hypothetical protein